MVDGHGWHVRGNTIEEVMVNLMNVLVLGVKRECCVVVYVASQLLTGRMQWLGAG